jgi:hypothetical protein
LQPSFDLPRYRRLTKDQQYAVGEKSGHSSTRLNGNIFKVAITNKCRNKIPGNTLKRTTVSIKIYGSS